MNTLGTSESGTVTSVQASLDLVLFAGGRYFGKDEAGTIEKFGCSTSELKHEISVITPLMSDVANLRSQLEADSQLAVDSVTTPCALARAHAAAAILRRLDSGNLSTLTQQMTEVRDLKELKYTRAF